MTRTVAVIVGSARTGSITRRVAEALIARAPAGLACEVVPIADLPMYNQDHDTAPPAEWVAFRDRVRPMDGVLFATPEYNRSMPALLKNAIDIGSRPYGSSIWGGKPTGVVTVSPGAQGGALGNHAVRQALVFLDMPVMQQPEAYIGNAAKLFGDDGEPVEATAEFFTKFMTAYAKWVERLTA